MEKLIIAIIIAAISGMFNNKAKKSQKKTPMYPKARSKKDFYKHDTVREITEQKPKKTENKTYEAQYSNAHKTQYNNYEVNYEYMDKIEDKTEHKDLQSEEYETDRKEILDAELFDLQKAIVMSEILSKPLALRKK